MATPSRASPPSPSPSFNPSLSKSSQFCSCRAEVEVGGVGGLMCDRLRWLLVMVVWWGSSEGKRDNGAVVWWRDVRSRKERWRWATQRSLSLLRDLSENEFTDISYLSRGMLPIIHYTTNIPEQQCTSLEALAFRFFYQLLQSESSSIPLYNITFLSGNEDSTLQESKPLTIQLLSVACLFGIDNGILLAAASFSVALWNFIQSSVKDMV
ncbi:UPF0481 plant-like protein [Sesbania bispinosa]|nr:UPF0481 plant-like protein [Sesbania bispinosa]